MCVERGFAARIANRFAWMRGSVSCESKGVEHEREGFIDRDSELCAKPENTEARRGKSTRRFVSWNASRRVGMSGTRVAFGCVSPMSQSVDVRFATHDRTGTRRVSSAIDRRRSVACGSRSVPDQGSIRVREVGIVVTALGGVCGRRCPGRGAASGLFERVFAMCVETKSISDSIIESNESLREENRRLWEQVQSLRQQVARLESRLELSESRLLRKGSKEHG